MIEPFIDALTAEGDPARAAGLRAHHRIDRPYLGLTHPQINALAADWRDRTDLPGRIALADGLWRTNIFEARLAAARLLTQARLRPDDSAAWNLIVSWVPDFDSAVLADHASMAGQKRVVSDPGRLDEVAEWTTSGHLWTRRAALVITLPWTRQNHPDAAETATRERILGWAADYAGDQTWEVQKALAQWLHDLSKHDPDRVRAFLKRHAPDMRPSAVKEAARRLPKA